LRRKEVVFIGAWCLRKGAADWSEIVARTREFVPDAKFRFLGTGQARANILRDLGLRDAEWISVVPHFDADKLPGLLASATVGTLPSYIEGCPFGILEQLAAGLPTIAYDVPGSRLMLGRLTRSHMAPRGDTSRFAELLANLLTLDEGSYSKVSAECAAVAQEFRCSTIAEASLEAYARELGMDAGALNKFARSSSVVPRLARGVEHR
jgi:glycosyltransferase involved in cell wall biosynthesis